MPQIGEIKDDGSGLRFFGHRTLVNRYGNKIRGKKIEWWITEAEYQKRREKIRLKNLNWRKNNREHYRQYKRELNRKNPEKNRVRARKWAVNNPEKVKAVTKKAYKKNPKRFKESTYRWRNANRNKVLEYRKQWRAQRAEIENERTRKWRAANPEKTKESARKSYRENADLRARHKAYAAKRKATLKDAFFRLNDGEQLKLLKIYKIAELISEHTGIIHHVDHWHPLARGGKHHPDNLVIVKAEENLKKKAIPVEKLAPSFFSCIHLPIGFFQMDWIWRGGRKPRKLNVSEGLTANSQSATNPQ
jgi:flagellar hook protein FlgE